MKTKQAWDGLLVCLITALFTFLPAGVSVAETERPVIWLSKSFDTLDADAAGELPPLTPRAGPDHDGDGTDSDVDTDDDDDRISDADEGLIDADGDGIPDTGSRDSDGDGVVDGLDSDSDNDGIPDWDEAITHGSSGLFTPIDTDLDSIPDYLDLDSDNDGIFDLVEAGGTDSDNNGLVDNFSNTNGKGIDDGLLASSLPIFDTDLDGTHDYRDLDSDDDTIPDSVEKGSGTASAPLDTDNDGAANYRETDSDGDGLSDEDEVGPDPNSPLDTDNDGDPDYIDLDSNNDGLNDNVPSPDTDGDGIPNQLDLDDDNDGILDTDEGLVDADGNGVADAASTDTDGDGTPDVWDLDSDNDGILDLWEASADVVTLSNLDTDANGAVDISFPVGNNGVPDALETSVDSAALITAPVADTDSDGTPDFRDLDSDADNIFDLLEAGGVDVDGNGRVDGFTDVDGKGVDDTIQATALPVFDTDGDGVLDFRDNDSDADSLPDITEAGSQPNSPTDSDADGAPDFRETDSDGDGLSDTVEAGGNPSAPVDTDNDGTPDYQDLDSNNDGVNDGQGTSGPDIDGDGIPNQIDLDDDNDGITDVAEGAVDADNDGFLDANSVDTDGDGTPDAWDLDSDNDGILDLWERSTNVAAAQALDLVVNGAVDIAFPVGANGIPDALETSVDSGVLIDALSDFDSDGLPDFRDLDSDGDGIFDLIEAGGTDSNNDGSIDGFVDVDDKGVDDTIQNSALPVFDTDGDGALDFRDSDSDGDTIPDSVESGGSSNAPTDTDGDGAPDFRETDSDNDTLPDNVEMGSDPNSPVDTDSDGTPDFQDLDSDNDGTPDGSAPTNVSGPDTDGDGIPNQLDLDDDNDGIPDTIEGAVDTNNDGFLEASSVDSDGDGTPDAWDLDSDNDGILDNEESRLDLALVQSLDQVVDGAIDIGVPVGANGLADILETSPDSGILNFNVVDTDNDGIRDFRDIDSDNDGTPDLIEAGGTDADGDGRIDNFGDADGKGVDDNVQVNALPVFDTDNDGLADFRDTDSDNDTIPDSVEMGNIPNQPTDTDGDNAPDFRELDSDNDSIPDNIEAGGNPAAPVDTDGDGIPDFQDTDSDGDSIPDSQEQPNTAMAPFNNDIDNDGVSNDNDLDDDNDGIPDINEGIGDADGDSISNQHDLDSDNDGVFDIQEASLSLSHSTNLDADGDGVVDNAVVGTNGLADSLETAPDSGIISFMLADADGDGVPDFLDVDSDNDSIYDSLESRHIDANVDGQIDATGPLSAFGVLPGAGGEFVDSDDDGVIDSRDLDSDNDGLTDLVEAGGTDADGNGRIDGFIDTDGDGGNDLQAQIPVIPPDTDGDRLHDFRDLDSDNDGLSDILEIGGPTLDQNGDGMIDDFVDTNGDGLDDGIAAQPLLLIDTDGDAFADNLDLDSDSDGLFDIIETGGIDADGDGVVDDMSDVDNDGVPDVVDSDVTGGADTDFDSIDDAFDASITGGSDMDNDGIIDSADPDADGDGFAGIADDGVNPNLDLTDADGNGVLDFQQVDGNVNPVTGPSGAILQTGLSGSGFGCAISSVTTLGSEGSAGKRGFDPLFLLMLLAAFAGAARSLFRARPTSNKTKPDSMKRALLTTGTVASTLLIASCGSFGSFDFRLPELPGRGLFQSDGGSSDFKRRIYVGAGAGVSQLEPDASGVASVTVSESASAGGQLTLGYDLSNRFSAEVHGATLGQAELAPAGEIGYQVGGLSGIAYFLNGEGRGRREGLSLFGRLGVGTMRNQAEVVQFERVNDFHLLGGLGVEYGFNFGLAARAELISFDEDAQYAQLGLVYRFGDAARPAPRPRPPIAPQPQPLPQPVPQGPSDSDQDGVPDNLDNCRTTPFNTPVDQQGCAMFAGVIEGVNFETSSAQLTAEAVTILEDVASTLLRYPEVRVTIEAHTDNRGSAASNLELSKQRAISVAKFLVERGISGGRLQPQAYGESRPRASNATAAGRFANRRVEFNTL